MVYVYRGNDQSTEEAAVRNERPPRRRKPRTRSATIASRPIPQCGTRSAIGRHRKLGELVDEACLAADAAYQRQRYARKKAGL